MLEGPVAKVLWITALCACVGPGCVAADSRDAAPGAKDAPAPAQVVHIAVAASFRVTAEALGEHYRARHPGVELRVFGGPSHSLARRALELGEPLDVLVLADAALFPTLLQPAWTEHHVAVATDRMVLARSPHAAARGLVAGSDDWPAVLLRDEVRFGLADPLRAPLGYRALLVLQLAERRLNRPGLAEALRARAAGRYEWPDAAGLLAPLESGAIDFAFVYSSSAREAGLEFVELGAALDLGDPARAAEYATASVRIAGRKPGQWLEERGAPILYAAAARRGASPEAMAWLALLTSAEGRTVLAQHGFAPPAP